jgi:proteasome lid subunit RPN8/RPN11
MGLTSITMTKSHWQSMEAHVRASVPREACGILAGDQGKVHWVESVTNVEDRVDRFRMDPQEQVDMILRIESEGLFLIGIYHSHPHGPEELSEKDIQEAAYFEAAQILWSPDGDQWSCRAYLIEHQTAREIPVYITGTGTQLT